MESAKFLQSLRQSMGNAPGTSPMDSNFGFKSALDPKIAEIESPLIMYTKIKKILWASGDKKEPMVETIQAMHTFIEEILTMLYHPNVLSTVIKWHNPMISKRFKLRKLLKYLLKMFPVETCTYFSTNETKVSLKI